MLDRIDYVAKAEGLEKTITKVVTVQPKELPLELEALSAQLSDLKAGKTETPEDQAVIDVAIANYEAQKVVLEAEVAKLPVADTPVDTPIGGFDDPRVRAELDSITRGTFR